MQASPLPKSKYGQQNGMIMARVIEALHCSGQSSILIQKTTTNDNGNIGYLNQTSRAEEEVIKKRKGKAEAASPNMAEAGSRKRSPSRHSPVPS
jgi:hypothetical protein